MKTFKKVLASTLAAAMVVTAFPVTNAEAASTAKLSATKATVYVGGSKTLSVKTPSNWKNVKVKATSSKKSIAKISKVSGKKVTVKAVKKGTAKVTVKVTAKKAGKTVKKTLKATVTVKNPSLKTNVTKVVVNAGNTATIKATATPSSAKVTFASKDKAIATVSSKGVVTGVAEGTTKIVVTAKYGTKKVTKTVDVSVNDKVADGITTMLTNAYSEDYPDVVVTNPEINKDGTAVVKAVYGRNNKAVQDMYLNVKYTVTTASGSKDYTDRIRTDNYGVAYWDDYETTDNANVSYTITATDDASVVATGTFRVGTISIGDVDNINGDKDANGKLVYEGYGNLVAGTNNVSGSAIGDSLKASAGTYTTEVNGEYSGLPQYWTEYVTSEQVDNKVGFVGGVPTITFAGEKTQLTTAERFSQDVNLTSGDYGVYATKSEYITLNANPNELTYATLNFSSLKLSQYTGLYIETFKDEATAKKTSVDVSKEPTVKGPYSKDDFSYQIPLDQDRPVIKVTLVSEGQVNTETNKGYVIKDITGVYKTRTSGKDKTETLKGAKVTWSAGTAKYSEEKVVDTTIWNNVLKNYLADNTVTGSSVSSLKDMATNKDISKMTYSVPVFPYTGNAIVRAYDKNGNVIAYFACPTENTLIRVGGRAVSANINDVTTGQWVYRISEEEATKSVGTVSQSDVNGKTLVTVESNKVGTTVVEGKVSGIPGLDATNDTVYTSVQWNPVPSKTDANGGAIALAGQDVVLTAQLVDKEQNPVAAAGKGVKFSYTKGTHAANVAVLGTDSQNTNSKGQAELTVTATAKNNVLTNIEAKSDDSRYDAVLLVNGQKVKKLDLYWVEAAPCFTPGVTTPDCVTIKTSPVTGKCNPKIGENWEYGFQATGDTLADAGVWAKAPVTVKNVKIAVTSTSNNSTTVKDAENGAVYATASKPGVTTLSAVVDGTAYDSNGVSFDVKDKASDVKSVGQGATTFKNEQKLEVKWATEGQHGAFIDAPGTNAVTGTSIKVYFKVSDKLGNGLKGELGTFALTNAVVDGTPTNVTCAGVNATTGSFVTSPSGVVSLTVKQDSSNMSNKSVVAFTYDGVIYKEVITWNELANAPKLKVTTDATVNGGAANADNPYTTYCDGKKLVLTFNDDVLASSVRADQFTVTRTADGDTAKKQNIASVSVSGKTITINFTNAITDNTQATYEVTINSVTSDDVTYSVVSTKGAALYSGTISSIKGSLY